MERKGDMLLSILVCTLEDRKTYLDKLIGNLEHQLKGHEDTVELLIESDKGQLSIGEKRNDLLDKAKGEYIAFVDDDDIVAPNYVDLILKAIQSKPDVVGMNLIMTTNGLKAERSFHTIKFDRWFDRACSLMQGHRVYFRNPNHLNPVRRELALKVKFPAINMKEDRDYSSRLYPLLKTEVFIEQPIYFYLYLPIK